MFFDVKEKICCMFKSSVLLSIKLRFPTLHLQFKKYQPQLAQ